jgi:hypothetical protein
MKPEIQTSDFAKQPRRRSHDPMLEEYNRALSAAVSEADGVIVQAKNSYEGAIARVASRANEGRLAQEQAKKARLDNAGVIEADEAVKVAVESLKATENLAEVLRQKMIDAEVNAHKDRLAEVEAEWATKWEIWTSSCEANDEGSTAGLKEKIAAVLNQYKK